LSVNKKVFLFVYIIILFASTASWAQQNDVTTIQVQAAGDIFTLPTNPDSIGVCVDRCQKEMDAATIRIVQPGFYRIFTGVEYSEGQGNESFYVQFRQSDSSLVPQLEPNAGIEKVVPDTSFRPSLTSRDAGKFYFPPGIYTIHLKHYYFLQYQYPQFLNPPDVPMHGQSPESVHIYNFQFAYEGDKPPQFDISIEKSANYDSVFPGEEIEFELQIANSGPDTAGTIHISDAMPEFLQFIAANPTPDSAQGRVVHWNFTNLSANETQRISYTAVVQEDIPDTVTQVVNFSAVDAPGDTDLTNNQATDTVSIKRKKPTPAPRCDLTINKTVSADSVTGFSPFSYRIIVKNMGPDSAFRVIVTDSLPAEISVTEFSPAPDSVAGQKIFWFTEALAAGDSSVFSLNAQADSSLADHDSTVENHASADAANDTLKTNNQAQCSTFIYWNTPPQPKFCDVSLSKTVSADTIRQGDAATFRLSISNVGPATAKKITVADSLPPTLAPLDFSIAPDSAANSLLFWKFDSLEINAEIAITFQARTRQSFSDTTFQIVNYANVSVPLDTFSVNNYDSAAVIFWDRTKEKIFNCDLLIEKLASKDSLFAGDTLRYFLKIQNLSKNTAQRVTLVDSLPDFLSPKIFSENPDSTAENLLFWHFDSLTGRGEKTISFIAQVDSHLTENISLKNVGAVAAENDTNLANNRDSFSVFAQKKWTPPPVFHCDLQLAKTADKDTVRFDEQLRYLLTVENLGRETARQITVSDTLPAMLTVLGTSPKLDSLNSPLTWQFDSLAAGEKIRISIFTRLATADYDTAFPMTNFAFVNASNDSDLSNNSGHATTTVAVANEPAQYQLELKKEVSKDSVKINEEFDYEISLRNLGPDVAREITLVDSMTSAIIPLAFAPQPDSVVGRMYFWFIDSITVGQTKMFVVTAKLDSQYATADSAVFNVAGIFDSDKEEIRGYRVRARVIPVDEREKKPFGSPKLELSKSADKDTVKVGESFTYSIQISNIGDGAAYHIAVSDTLPENISVANVNPLPDSAKGRILFWSFDSLAGGGTILIQYDAAIDRAPDSTPFSLQNVAVVSAENDTNLVGERTKRHRIVIAEEKPEKPEHYNLEIQKTADRDTVQAGDSFTYQLKVFNHGPGVAFHVTLFDSLPELITGSDFQPAPDSVHQKKLFWFIDTLQPGQQFVASFKATLELTLPKTIMPIMNVAGIYSPDDTSTTDDEDEAEIVANIETKEIDCDHSYYFDVNVFQPDLGRPLQIHFHLSQSQTIELDLYDIRGYHISTIAEKFYHQGENTFSWDGRTASGQPVGSGVYIIALRTQEMDCWKKIIIVR